MITWRSLRDGIPRVDSLRSCTRARRVVSTISVLLLSGLAYSTSVSALTLSWVNNSSDADGIQIERATSASGTWSNIATVGGTATDYTDTSTTCGVAYYYRVRAFNQAGLSGYSNTSGPAVQSCQSTTDVPNSGNGAWPFRILAIAREGNDIRVTWNAMGGESYVVEVSPPVGDKIPINYADLSPMIVMPGRAASTTNYVDVGGATKSLSRFYRVRQVTGQLSADDTDGDGLPDSWELQYFGKLSQDSNDDPDGDGFSNKQEYAAGTDPTNGASYLHITAIAREKNNIRVTWMMGAGKTNVLQVVNGGTTGSFSVNNFTDLFAVTNTVGTATNYLDVGAATNSPSRFYRVRLVP